MISVSLPWVVLMAVIAAAGCVLAYRLGAASLRPTVLSLRNQLIARE